MICVSDPNRRFRSFQDYTIKKCNYKKLKYTFSIDNDDSTDPLVVLNSIQNLFRLSNAV